MSTAPLIWLLLLLPTTALAADGVDAHGPVNPPGDGDVRQPLMGFHPARAPRGAITGGATLELVDRALVRYTLVDGEVDSEEVLFGEALGLNLGGTWSPSARISLGVTAPVWLFATGDKAGGGPALGDVHLWAPVGVVLPEADGTGFGLSLVPFVDLPTGNQQRLLGDPGLGGGVLAATGWSSHAAVLTGNLGLEGRGIGGFEKLTGGPALRLGAAAAWLPRDDLSLRAEWRHVADLNAGEEDLAEWEQLPDGAENPGEVVLGARGRVGEHLWWSAGLGRGLTAGLGSPRSRVLLGVGWAPALPEASGPVPQAQPGLFLSVVDPTGQPIPRASLLVGGQEEALTDTVGQLTLDKAPRWRKGVSVSAPGFLSTEVAEPQDGRADVVLRWQPVPVRVEVQDVEGQPVDAALTLTAEDQEPLQVQLVDGAVEARLDPGLYTLRVDAQGYGSQERGLVVRPGQARVAAPEIILAPDQGGPSELVLAVADEDGEAVPDARVLVDGLPIGTTGGDGTAALLGMAAGAHKVEINADTFQTVEGQQIQLQPGRTQQAMVLQRDIGSVRVRARGPHGPVSDAVVRFFGASRLPPAPLGDDGERTMVVRPGTWTVLVTSAEYGLQDRTIIVPEDDNRLIEVEVVLRPREEGAAELALRVLDPDGQPVSGAQVSLDGAELGSTSTGGALRVQDLLPGVRQLQVQAQRYRSSETASLMLVEGVQEHLVTLEWEPGTVHLLARTPSAPLPDAVARFSGPASQEPLQMSSRGEAWTQLDPGQWQVLLTSPSAGMQQRDLAVPEDSRRLLEVDVVMSPDETGQAQLDLSVVGPEGRPVEGARVFLDGTPLGQTSAGAASLRRLAAGRRTLRIEHDLYLPASKSLRLADGQQSSTVQLDWAPGLVNVVARAEGQPVTGATVRFAGPELRSPVQVDGQGRRRVVLSPGQWQALVAAPGYGLQQRPVEVGESQGPQDLVFDLQPVDAGIAEVLVRVVGPDGEAVPQASVQVSGVEVGQTTAGGLLLMPEREPGTLDLAVQAADYLPARMGSFEVVEGRNERIIGLELEPSRVDVTVRDTTGQPISAELRFSGPAEVQPVRTDAQGQASVLLRPGAWRVLASADELGTRSAELDLARGQGQAAVQLELQAAKVQVTGGQVVIEEQVHFDFDAATLTAASGPILDEVAASILAHPEVVQVQVQGHTDAKGGVAYNQRLSQQRAEAVVAALVQRGVEPERLVARGFGPTRPVADNESEAGRAQNRRVQFEILDE